MANRSGASNAAAFRATQTASKQPAARPKVVVGKAGVSYTPAGGGGLPRGRAPGGPTRAGLAGYSPPKIGYGGSPPSKSGYGRASQPTAGLTKGKTTPSAGAVRKAGAKAKAAVGKPAKGAMFL